MSSAPKITLVILTLLASRAALGEGFTVGPGFGTFKAGAGAVAGIDVTVLPSKEHWATWLSAGLRGTMIEGNQRNLPYFEMGAWTFLNLGMGITLATGGGYKTSVLGHGFIGAPIGTFGDAPAFYIEPYWRPTYGALVDKRGWYNEFGVLFKVGFARAKLNLRF